MALWTVLNINYIVTLSMVVSVILIIVTGMDIVFLASLDKNKIMKACIKCSNLLLVQQSKFAVLCAQVVNNVAFIVTVKQNQVYWKLLVCSMSANFGLCLLRNLLNWLNIYIRLGNEEIFSNWIRFEIHPINIIGQSLLAEGISVAHLIWFFGYGRKHKTILGREKMFGVNLKMFLRVQTVFQISHLILFVFNRTQMYFNEDIRNKTALKDPSVFVTSSIMLAFSMLNPIWYYFDVNCAIKQNLHERILRYFQGSVVLIPIFQTLRLWQSVQDHYIFDFTLNYALISNVVLNVASVYTFAVCIALFLYALHVEQYSEANLQNGNNYKNISLRRGSFKVKIIPRKRIQVESKPSLGSGHSSTVYTGTLQSSQGNWRKTMTKPVAIKVVWGNNHDSGVASAIAEELRNMSRAMKQYKHPNLVGFYGACFQNSSSIISPLGAVNIVMELCENGSLDEHLIKMSNEMASRGSALTYQCSMQLISWAGQIATGMEFLARQNIIHGDLAARNILLDSKLIAKISDFGMSRKLYDYQIYVSTQQTVFPWRWMAPESLDGLKFSTASDVWSYGVLMWELFSFGTSPWAEKIWSSDFVGCLIAGERLPKPIFASNLLYNRIMLDCWKIRMEDRPTFSELLERLTSSNSESSFLLLKCLTELSVV